VGIGRRLSSAGSSVSVQNRLMNMPVPEISPSSATPTKSVGTNAKKPIAVVIAQRKMELPTSRAVSLRATECSSPLARSSR